jgi:hypothetical protein
MRGAWEMHYSAEGKAIRGWMSPVHLYDGVEIAEAVSDLSPEIYDSARQLADGRENWTASLDLRLAVKQVD